MSAIGFLVLLVIAIIALMLLMTKVKLNPVMSLFVVALGFGVTLGIFGTEGYSFMETLTLITTGFGNTLGSLGMQESGAGPVLDGLCGVYPRVRRYYNYPLLQHRQRAGQA